MTSSEATPFPIDFSKLRRGDVISRQQVSSIWGNAYGTAKFQLDCLRLSKMIRDYFADIHGDFVSITVRSGSIFILDHKVQDEDVQVGKRAAIARYLRRHREDMGTDASKLTPVQRSARERRLLVDSWKVQQLTKRRHPRLGE